MKTTLPTSLPPIKTTLPTQPTKSTPTPAKPICDNSTDVNCTAIPKTTLPTKKTGKTTLPTTLPTLPTKKTTLPTPKATLSTVKTTLPTQKPKCDNETEENCTISTPKPSTLPPTKPTKSTVKTTLPTVTPRQDVIDKACKDDADGIVLIIENGGYVAFYFGWEKICK